MQQYAPPQYTQPQAPQAPQPQQLPPHLYPPQIMSPPKRPRRIGWIIAVSLLAVALLATGTILAVSLIRLDQAREIIDEQDQIIDEKDTFTTAMRDLAATADEFDGVLYGDIVSQRELEVLASRGWNDRRNSDELAHDTDEVRALTDDLTELLDAAQLEASTNTSGSTYEATIDTLGGGFVTSIIDDADTLCESDVLACVMSDDAYTVHFDAADAVHPSMTDWIRTGVAYHEFAHVLQLTNPDATEDALASFGGDPEIMADCFALTFLDGWTLDHVVWVNDVEYWEISVGYGYTCDESQHQVIRDWYDELGYHSQPISQ